MAVISKEERYAMIRKAALKVQKRAKVRKSNAKLANDVIRLDSQDYKSEISWSDSERYAKAHYGEVYQSTCYEEWN